MGPAINIKLISPEETRCQVGPNAVQRPSRDLIRWQKWYWAFGDPENEHLETIKRRHDVATSFFSDEAASSRLARTGSATLGSRWTRFLGAAAPYPNLDAVFLLESGGQDRHVIHIRRRVERDRFFFLSAGNELFGAIGALMVYPETDWMTAVDLSHFAMR